MSKGNSQSRTHRSGSILKITASAGNSVVPYHVVVCYAAVRCLLEDVDVGALKAV